MSWLVGPLAVLHAGQRSAYGQETSVQEAQFVRPASELSDPAEPGRGAAPDEYQLAGRLRTTVRGLRRALLPGPGGAIVESRLEAPFHQALGVSAWGVDTPIERDGVDLHVAAYGQVWAGAPLDYQDATWDLASAYVIQRLGRAALTLGRQVVAGGAARYSRFDGALFQGTTDFGATFLVYSGLTVLPRSDQWYGYHHLGDAYEQWAGSDARPLTVARGDQWQAGFRLGWTDPDLGGATLSFHQQDELGSLTRRDLGVNVHLDRFEAVDVLLDAIYSLEQYRWSDARLSLGVTPIRKGPSPLGLRLRGDLLHTVPAALLSQASVFSVFSHGEVSEAGGGAEVELPLGMNVDASGHAQLYSEGNPGVRARLGYELRDARRTFLVRLAVSRVSVERNGYWQLRAATSLVVRERVTLSADLYHYRYDERISGRRSSSFGGMYAEYRPISPLALLLGGSVAVSPYAALDAQVLGKVAYQWEGGR